VHDQLKAKIKVRILIMKEIFRQNRVCVAIYGSIDDEGVPKGKLVSLLDLGCSGDIVDGIGDDRPYPVLFDKASGCGEREALGFSG
jgi:hypothetical protein